MFHHHHHRQHGEAGPETAGNVIHWASRYDLVVKLLFFGKERQVREEALDLAGLRPGAAVLEVGCGTGTLTLGAKARVGDGLAQGLDPAPEMIAFAREKARAAGLDARFEVGLVEELPFEDESFDAVLSCLMLHHLTPELRRRGLGEIARVLKPGGRLVAVDFDPERGGLLQHLMQRLAGPERAQSTVDELERLMSERGFSVSRGRTSHRLLASLVGTKERPS